MKRVFLSLVFITLFLVGCGSDEGEKLGEINGDDFTDKDFMESIKENVDEESLQSLYLEHVVNEFSDEKLEDLFYEDYIKEYEDMDEELEEEDKENLKAYAKQDAGMVNIVQELGIVDEKDIDKLYKDNNKEYELRVASVQENVKPKRVKEIFKEDEDVKSKIDELGDEVSFVNKIHYTDLTIPEEYPEMDDVEKGDILTEEVEGITFIVEVRDVEKVEKEDIERYLIQKASEGSFDSITNILTDMEDEGLIKMKKDLREYLNIDEERA